MSQGLSKLVVGVTICLATIAAGFTQRRTACTVCLPDSVASNEPHSSLLVQEGGGSVLAKGGRFAGTRSHQRNHYATLRAYREAIGDQWKATVQILDENKQLALGTIVRSDGWITTKSTEVPDSPVDVRLFDGTKATGKVKIRRPDIDLALLKIERTDLPTIRWNVDASVPVGGWLASADSRALPLALGVVSVRSRTIRQETAVLGVQLSMKQESAFVDHVVVGSGAEKAGIRGGDVIVELDGKPMTSRRDVLDYLKTVSAGNRINIVVDREGSQVAMLAQMMDLSSSLLDPTEMEVNGSISARATGFRDVIQHDTVLAPCDCGGPLIDVDGNAVGINIARAGRICSYALPARVVAASVEEMLASGSAAAQASEVELASAESGITVQVLKPATNAP
ncbi:MAG: PDZ domain-containing protein [Pirellula sp.]|nr:PDZ domain-containing protein [Pirellula sp.]